jgi:hypothetical protein
MCYALKTIVFTKNTHPKWNRFKNLEISKKQKKHSITTNNESLKK